MPEIRQDPITGRRIIIAPERAARPRFVGVVKNSAAVESCPFCTANEDMTPPEVWSDRKNVNEPDTPGWCVRIVPNKYPAFQEHITTKPTQDDFFRTESAYGVHEVIIESPAHETQFSALTREQFSLCVRAYCARWSALQTDGRWRYLLIYKNHGDLAGATLEHVHSQLVALPIVPREAELERNAARARFDLMGRCIFCTMIERERETGTRIVAESDRFIALCPFAPRFAYETWILPKTHAAHFTLTSNEDLDGFAAVMRTVIQKLESIAENPPFNYLLRSAPLRERIEDSYHWHLEILPQFNRAAGFEWASGMFMNPVAPEYAARLLRNAPG